MQIACGLGVGPPARRGCLLEPGMSGVERFFVAMALTGFVGLFAALADVWQGSSRTAPSVDEQRGGNQGYAKYAAAENASAKQVSFSMPQA